MSKSALILVYIFLLLSLIIKKFETTTTTRIVCEYNVQTSNEKSALLLPENINGSLCTHINFNYMSISNEFELMFNTENDHCNKYIFLTLLKSYVIQVKILFFCFFNLRSIRTIG